MQSIRKLETFGMPLSEVLKFTEKVQVSLISFHAESAYPLSVDNNGATFCIDMRIKFLRLTLGNKFLGLH
jgi:hypothetical protein